MEKELWLRGRLLGRGAFARVYEVENLKNGKFYAGKFGGSRLVPEKGEESEEGEQILKDLQHAKRTLQNEINIHSKLTHPNIVQYINSFQTDSCFEEKEIVMYSQMRYKKGSCKILILELCKNKSVEEMLNLRGKVSSPEALFILYYIGKALSYLKSQNIIHRDVKPANIMFGGGDIAEGLIPKLGDFGLAVKIENPDKTVSRLIGSANFIAPEIIDQKYSFPVDLWALGVTFFYLVTGRPPFFAKTQEELFLNIQHNIYYISPKERDDFGIENINLLSKIFVRDPKQRISVEEFIDILNSKSKTFLEILPIEARAVSPI
ncbi:MAG TPA: serine/threonine-protein kinase [Saprospiraceae bacterium]|nr:serine/threonine-protein kinase [Saprospiraceae bacterium]